MRKRAYDEAVRTEVGTLAMVALLGDAKAYDQKGPILVIVVNENYQKKYSQAFQENLTMDEILDVLERPVRVAYIPPSEDID